MPYHIKGYSRRDVLRGGLGLGLGAIMSGCATYPPFHGLFDGRWREPRDAEAVERWALLSDPHISEDLESAVGSANMADHLRGTVCNVLERSSSTADRRPLTGVLVNGDCALEYGQPGDYATFSKLLVEPVQAAQLPLHLTLGNHDHREHFHAALAGYIDPDQAREAQGRLVSIIPGRCANFFLLDTLDQRYILAGEAGRPQIDWLARSLERLSDRPAIVVGHHSLDPETGLLGQNSSLLDAGPLWDVLTRFPHVKAYVFGHTHRWNVEKRNGIYLVNLPSTAYTFESGQPLGWVEMWLKPGGARLELRHLNRTHAVPGPGDSAILSWA